MVPAWLIERKRDGGALSHEEIRSLIMGYTRGEIPDYQMAAFAMAVFFRGMTFEEVVALTDAMMNSGELVDTSALKRPKFDKHSTGGIGDKVSLILAPLVASLGLAVPMISGRGLGITGGTLDKMDSIPGFRTNLSESEFVRVIDQCGCSIIGQTERLAPADKLLYALRDVTATVPSIPLISASIMCKKLAEGIDGLVLDVKYGAGAFMKEIAQARELARTMVAIGEGMGKRVRALLTTMDEPLGRTAGNALEVIECVEVLRGGEGGDLADLTIELGAHMLEMAGIFPSLEEARLKQREKLSDGSALKVFVEMVRLQGGDVLAIEDTSRLPHARFATPLTSPRNGVVTRACADHLGRAVLLLGGGRRKSSDAISFGVGLSGIKKIGEGVDRGEPLVVVHHDHALLPQEVEAHLHQAFEVTQEQRARSTATKVSEVITGFSDQPRSSNQS